MADAALSSGSNFVVATAVASRLDAAELGQYALAFTVYALGYGVWRAYACEPALAAGAHRVSVGAVVGSSTIVGLGLAAVGLAASAITPEPGIAGPLVWLSIGLPIHAAHDGLRFAAIGRGRPGVAAAIDGSWLLAMVPVALLAPSVTAVLIGWVAVGAGSLGAGLVAMRSDVGIGSGVGWLRRAAPLGHTYAAEFVVSAVGLQAVLIAVGAVAGYAEMGRYRVATIVASPVMVVVAGLATLVVVSGRRLADDDHLDRLRRLVIALTVLGASAGVAAAAVAAAVPSTLASPVLGPAWVDARAGSAWLSIAVGGIAMITVAANAHRVIGASRSGGHLRIAAMVSTTAAGIVGAAAAGALGATIAMAAAANVTGVAILLAFLRATAQRSAMLTEGDAAATTSVHRRELAA
ncbi:MAG: hypothetical protein AAF467_25050 [Actinomycetota bacterium]